MKFVVKTYFKLWTPYVHPDDPSTRSRHLGAETKSSGNSIDLQFSLFRVTSNHSYDIT